MSNPHAKIIRGPLLNPRQDGRVDWFIDGALAADDQGRTTFAGAWAQLAAQHPEATARKSDGILMPPPLDAHIHIPQYPIRGRFTEGIGPHAEGGRLLAGLNRNVFPAEARCKNPAYAEQVIGDFLAGTLRHGVVGGAAYMTVHARATRLALEILPESWSVGLVLMNQNCPADLRTDEANLDRDITELAKQFGRRLIVTDRFAPVVDSPLRQRAVALSERFGLRMQTHLNEQIVEKEFVENVLYHSAGTYTGVYRIDGLLARSPILAHCVRMSDAEFAELAAFPGALIAHCPTSNTLLGSGIMPLDKVISAGIDYAICTDVGASPTTSLLAEMAQFLIVHAGRSTRATPSEALYRVTQAPAAALGLDDRFGTFCVGKPLSFIEVAPAPGSLPTLVDDAIRHALLRLPADFTTLQAPLDQLATIGLDAGGAMNQLTRQFETIAANLARSVVRVTTRP